MNQVQQTVAASDVLTETADAHRWGCEKLALEAARRAAQAEGETCVSYHKRMLGRQSRCQAIHGSRYYIWDRPLWRLYVQREAVAFEVPQGATSKDVFKALADYREALKLYERMPPGYESELSSYGPVLFDGYCGEPIAWGFRLVRYLGDERFSGLRAFGEMECVRQGVWVLVTRWLTPEVASEEYGAMSDFETGPRGGFRSVTYGAKKFMSPRMRPPWM